MALRDDQPAQDKKMLCRLAMHQGKRVGGQGVVIFAQHVRARSKKLAVKFYLSKSAFDVEMAAALNPVRSHPVLKLLLKRTPEHGCILPKFRSVQPPIYCKTTLKDYLVAVLALKKWIFLSDLLGVLAVHLPMLRGVQSLDPVRSSGC